MRSHGYHGSACRMAPGGQQVPEAGRECQPASTSVPPAARLQREPFAPSLELTLAPALMGQLSKRLVVQHGLSSFLVSIA